MRFCDGQTGIIEAESNALIQWFQGGVLIPNESGVMLEVSETDEYVAVVGAGGTCEMSDTIQVFSIESPEFTIEGQLEACEDDMVPLTINGFNNESIEWQINGAVQMNETSEVFIAEDNALYLSLIHI